MVCQWCRRQYEDTPLFHICPDGTNMRQRMQKTMDEVKYEHARQDRVKGSFVMGKKKNPEDKEGVDYEVMYYTPYDLDLLNGIKIKI